MTGPVVLQDATLTAFSITGAADDKEFAAVLGAQVDAAAVGLMPPALRVLKRVASFLGRSPFFNEANLTVTFTATADIDERGRGTIAVDVTIADSAPAAVASVSVAPATANVGVGLTVPLTATPQDAGGNPLAGRVVTWSSSDPLIATVDATGVVTGVAAGVVTITATSEGQSGTAAVTVA